MNTQDISNYLKISNSTTQKIINEELNNLNQVFLYLKNLSELIVKSFIINNFYPYNNFIDKIKISLSYEYNDEGYDSSIEHTFYKNNKKLPYRYSFSTETENDISLNKLHDKLYIFFENIQYKINENTYIINSDSLNSQLIPLEKINENILFLNKIFRELHESSENLISKILYANFSHLDFESLTIGNNYDDEPSEKSGYFSVYVHSEYRNYRDSSITLKTIEDQQKTSVTFKELEENIYNKIKSLYLNFEEELYFYMKEIKSKYQFHSIVDSINKESEEQKISKI